MSDTTAVPTPKELAPELTAQVQTIRAMADAHNILAQGQYPASQFQSVSNSLNFLRSVHDRGLEIAASHAQADDVPELVAFKKAQAEAAAKESEVKDA